ncbi:MAG: riboflavin biosynthesis protein RibF [Bacteroidales bacterium]|nr:riboflavin biosynthesis protein RibF [Bacteroidales bacterium]
MRKMAVVSTGFFDGVHIGHRHVISALVAEARRRGEEATVVSFWPHPRNVLQDEARNLRLLTSLDEKKQLLTSLGVDNIHIVRFTREFSRMTTREYLSGVVRDTCGGSAVLIGYDNRIGSDLLDAEGIKKAAEEVGLDTIVTDCLSSGTVAVSSTKIREALAAGEVERASSMLGYRYSLHGVVVAGNKLGRTIGFPTANMQLYEPLKLIPANGVYEVEVETLDRRLKGMCNVGVRPTVGSGNARTVETNIFGFDEDIYGLDIRIKFVRKIRDEVSFPSLEALKAQLVKDRIAAGGV